MGTSFIYISSKRYSRGVCGRLTVKYMHYPASRHLIQMCARVECLQVRGTVGKERLVAPSLVEPAQLSAFERTSESP